MNQTFVNEVAGAIESYLAGISAGKGVFPVEILVRGQRNNLVVEVFLDGDDGVDTATCAEISRGLGKTLDEGPLRSEAYTLTVSSPGLDRPLKFPRQYPKHVGRGIALTVRTEGGTERIRGVLAGADGSAIRVRPGPAEGEREIGFGDILEARIEPRW